MSEDKRVWVAFVRVVLGDTDSTFDDFLSLHAGCEGAKKAVEKHVEDNFGDPRVLEWVPSFCPQTGAEGWAYVEKGTDGLEHYGDAYPHEVQA